MNQRNLLLIATVLAAIQWPPHLSAQTQGEQDLMEDPCKAEPRTEQDSQADQDRDLAEKLDRCNGVLKPPPDEDQEIEKPPPETGRTPVVPPSELPEQQPEPD